MKISRWVVFVGGIGLGLGLFLGGAALYQRLRSTQAQPSPLQVLYLSPSAAPELWAAQPDGQSKRKLTETGGKVYDYAPFPDGSGVIFSAANSSGGLDLWQLDLAGGSARRLLDCGADRCSEAAVAPDGKQIAYSRASAAENPGGSPAAGRIWLLELSSAASRFLYADALVAGIKPIWSPDGTRLAFYDPRAEGIRVKSLAGEPERFFATAIQASGSWSPDGKLLVFAASEQTPDSPAGRLFIADVTSGQVRPFLADMGGADFSTPAWSRQGDWLAIGVVLLGQGPGREIALVRSDGSQYRAFSEDWHYSNAAVAWDPSGTYLVSQQLALGASNSLPTVLVWNVKGGTPSVLAEDAALPGWLPAFTPGRR